LTPTIIRRAEQADLPSLTTLLLALQEYLEASNRDLWRMKPGAKDQLKGQLAARLKAGSSCVLVAEHPAAGVIGTIFGRIVTNSRYTPAQAGLVDQVIVHPDYRRQGVGTQLLGSLCEFFASQGVEDLSLRYVVGNDAAAAFWAAVGFRPRIITTGATRLEVQRRLSTMQDRT
jgi:GNAT superfamily N-acetyltransferase